MQTPIYKKREAQATLEFVFCILIVFLIFYSCVKAMQWTGKALVKPGTEHQTIWQEAMPGYNSTTKQMQEILDLEGDLPKADFVYRGNFMNKP